MEDQNEPDALATGYFKDHNGISHYFTVLPYQDLFLFQLKDPAKIDLEQLPGEIPLGASIWKFHGLLNIALEFKPEWGLQLGSRNNTYKILPIIDTFARMAMALGASSCIWLVDYNIRRKQVLAGEEASTSNKTLYARDQRLVEVVPEEWEHVDEAEIREDASNGFFGNSCSSITFVDDVNRVALYRSHSQRNSWDTLHEYPCQIRLLGWDNTKT
ncbi:hypothetical protein LCI18_003390 [Fusarium solani-melongenae]|uniref:Uncharacterized protein n=1 Tax=Fusarium solani subsp. cucurbitae TaxID=2747967 RepID=A0ACD3YU84_FUSSC|nr:hypothetical protein LCI18_003390 [Fusarium solani-melongenae]